VKQFVHFIIVRSYWQFCFHLWRESNIGNTFFYEWCNKLNFFVLFIDIKSSIFCRLNMLIKYRTGVVRCSRNAKCMSRTSMIVSRSIVHMRSSFTFKRPIPRWRPIIGVNRSRQMMDIIGKNDVITLADYHHRFQNSSLGMIDFS